MKKKEKIQVTLIMLLLLGIIVLIYLLNHFTGYTSDDYAYHFFYDGYLPTGKTKEIHNFWDVIVSQYQHYFLFNGRFVAHTLVQSFMQFNKEIFNVFNTGAFMSLGLMIVAPFFDLKKVKTYLVLIFTYLLMWFYLPEFGKTVLWLSGANNYLWMALFYTGFILIYLKNIPLNNMVWWIYPIIIIFGFLTGATNENSGPASMLVCLLLTIWFDFRAKKITVWRYLGVISGFIGSFLIISSPASQGRGRMELTLNNLLINFGNIQHIVLYLFRFLILILIILIVLAALTENGLNKENVVLLCILLLGFLASANALILSSQYPLRTFFGSCVFLIMMCMIPLRCLLSVKGSFFQTFMKEAIIVLTIVFMIQYVAVFKDNKESYNEVNEQISMIKQAENKGEMNVTVPLLLPSDSLYNAYNGTENLSTNNKAWFNQWMAKYYGVNKITGE